MTNRRFGTLQAGLRKSSGDHVMLNESLAERMPRRLEEWPAYRAKAESRD
jgi:hypothetical protein